MKQLILTGIFAATGFLFGCGSDKGDSSLSGSNVLESNTSWPYRLEGNLDVIDAAESDSDISKPGWIIGTITPKEGGEDILIEFKDQAAKNSGLTMDFEYTNPIVVWVNPAVNEYYQVESME